jgi:hypothetical protein
VHSKLGPEIPEGSCLYWQRECEVLVEMKYFVLQSNDKYCTSSYVGHVKITWPIFFFFVYCLFHLSIIYGLVSLVLITSLEKDPPCSTMMCSNSGAPAPPINNTGALAPPT